MRCSLAFFAVYLLTLLAGVEGRAAEELFSKVPIQSVYSPNSNNLPTPAQGPGSERIGGIGSLSDSLRSAGFDPKLVGGDVVTIKVQRGNWTLPVVMTMADDQATLWLVMLLGGVSDEKTLPTEKLLKLLDTNREVAPSFFAYSTARKRVELHQLLRMEGLTAAEVQSQLKAMTDLAEKTQDLWNFGQKSAEAATPSTSATPTTTAPNPTPTSTATAPAVKSATKPAATGTLTGKWTSARSDKEAFALQLNADGSFVLVHVRDGKTNRSQGKFTLNGQQLTLAGADGTKLSGGFNLSSANEFQFQLQNSGTKLSFKKAQ